MKTNINLKQIFYVSFAITSLMAASWFILYTVANSELWDFNVFYSSAQATLNGDNIYRTYGQFHLPYWYFPWASWFFIPLAIFPFEIAKIIYTLITFLSVFFIIRSTGLYFNAQLSLANQMIITAMSILMCWLLFRVGQADFILAALVTEAIFLIDKKRNFQAGLLFPIFLFKPHLLIIFIPFAVLRGGKKFILSAALSLLTVSLIAFILIPNWPSEMLRMLHESGNRTDNNWGFTTLSALFGREENWSGTGNLPITIIITLIAFITVWKNQHLPTIPFLVLALSASLLCAPRAYSYNFPFLLPALLWLSVEKTTLIALVWMSLGILAFITNFSTGAYLIVMITYALSFLKARKLAGNTIEGG
jgi:alpha-1,2-mannosyltransferase